MTDIISDIWKIYNDNISEKEVNTDEEITCICKEMNIKYDERNGMNVCVSCGVVIEDNMIDEKAEWNNYSDEFHDNPSRCGMPINPLLQHSSMSTIIKNNKNKFMGILHNQMSMTYNERSRYKIFEYIAKVSSENGKLNSSIIEQAKYYYKEISEKKLSRGSIRQGLIACCILYACKYMKSPRSIKEISKITGVSVPIINKTNKIFIEHMHKLENKTIIEHNLVTDNTTSEDLITRFCNSMHINECKQYSFIKEVRKINEYILEHKILTCKTPSAIVLGIILYLCKKKNICVLKKSISDQYNISIVTMNKIIKTLETSIITC